MQVTIRTGRQVKVFNNRSVPPPRAEIDDTRKATSTTPVAEFSSGDRHGNANIFWRRSAGYQPKQRRSVAATASEDTDSGCRSGAGCLEAHRHDRKQSERAGLASRAAEKRLLPKRRSRVKATLSLDRRDFETHWQERRVCATIPRRLGRITAQR